MSDVFISYARTDQPFVRKLHTALAKLNRDTWVDWEDIPLTAEWLKEIYAGIEAADTFVFVISPDSVASKTCNEEITHAAKHNKRIVPIMYRDVPDSQIPQPLRPINWIFFRVNDDFDTKFKALIQVLDTDMDWVRAHTRLLTRAIEWDNKKRNGAFVLRGADLRAAEEWLAQAATSKEPKPTALQSEYILASRKNATRQQRVVLSGVTLALVVAIVLAIIAVFQWNAAVNQARISDSRRLATQSAFNREQNFSLALLLGSEAIDLDNNLEGRGNLLDSLANKPQLANYMHGHTSSVLCDVFSPDGKTLVSGSYDDMIIMWDISTALNTSMATRQRIGQPFVGLANDLSSTVFSPDGKTLASLLGKGTIILQDRATYKQIGQPLTADTDVRSVAFSPDGKTLASRLGNGTIILWDVMTHQLIGQPLTGYSSELQRCV